MPLTGLSQFPFNSTAKKAKKDIDNLKAKKVKFAQETDVECRKIDCEIAELGKQHKMRSLRDLRHLESLSSLFYDSFQYYCGNSLL